MRHEIYGKGWAVKVIPEDRAIDVQHYLLTGHLLGGRSLDGVQITEIVDKEYEEISKRREKALTHSMKVIHEKT